MNKFFVLLTVIFPVVCCGQATDKLDEEALIKRILAEPSPEEIKMIIKDLKKMNLSPQNVITHDSVILANGNQLYILSHVLKGKRHYGAVIVPGKVSIEKLPVMIMATGGDGVHTQFDITQDFNHHAVRFPQFLGPGLDDKFMVVIPSFRGQQLIIGDKKYQSEGKVSDAFHGATTDALAFLNVVLNAFEMADEKRIGIFGGSRGGTVALLSAARDKRIKRVVVVAAPTDMKSLYLLYPNQFKLLFFNDLLAGKISEKAARKAFISSSPIYFIDELPKVQLHHDRNDPFVPVSFAKKLGDKMVASGKGIDLHYYEEGIHGFWSDPGFWKRVQRFVKQLENE